MQKHNQKYIGSHTQKAIKNYPFSFRRTDKDFIYTIVEIKKASALAHASVGELPKNIARAIGRACDEILAGAHDSEFDLPAFQGGAGTSNHMNVNEVVAMRATEIIGKKNIVVHPNDHVNMSHSTNDTMPSALRITAIKIADKLFGTLEALAKEFEKKGKELKNIPKLGRTHMQDAVPIRLGEEFTAYAFLVRRGVDYMQSARSLMLELNLGGSAVGNSLNASKKYIAKLYPELKKITKLPVRPAKNLMAQTGSHADIVAFSQALTALLVDLSKIASDLRLMSSGPKGGFGEISLPELAPGSSIMPGKVNPILPEAVNQLYFLVSGNNLTIEKCAEASQLELGAMLPVMTDRLLESLKISDELLSVFAERTVKGIVANRERCLELLENSMAYGTALSPKIGYDNVAIAVKYALSSGKTLREAVLEKKFLTASEFDRLTK